MEYQVTHVHVQLVIMYVLHLLVYMCREMDPGCVVVGKEPVHPSRPRWCTAGTLVVIDGRMIWRSRTGQVTQAPIDVCCVVTSIF